MCQRSSARASVSARQGLDAGACTGAGGKVIDTQDRMADLLTHNRQS